MLHFQLALFINLALWGSPFFAFGFVDSDTKIFKYYLDTLVKSHSYIHLNAKDQWQIVDISIALFIPSLNYICDEINSIRVECVPSWLTLHLEPPLGYVNTWRTPLLRSPHSRTISLSPPWSWQSGGCDEAVWVIYQLKCLQSISINIIGKGRFKLKKIVVLIKNPLPY